MKKTIIQTSPYEKKQIVKNSQHISVSDYREVSLDDILKKITNEIEKRKKNLNYFDVALSEPCMFLL